MRVIILNREKRVVIVVIRITDIPIQPAIQFERHSRFGRLKRHWIGINQDDIRWGYAVALTVVLINAISGVERQPRGGLYKSVGEEKVFARVVLALADASLITDRKQDSRDARDADMRVTAAQREFRIRRPIDR